MANEKIKYIISVDNKQALSEINQFANQSIDAGGRVSTAWKTAAKTIAAVGATAGIAAATKAVKDSVGAYSDFQKELANVSTLVDTNVVSMEKLKKQILDLPSALGSATENTKALYQAISAGVDPNAAVGFVAESAKAAKAGLSDTFTAVEGGTTILNAFGMSADQVTGVFDKMFVAVKAGKTTFEELATSVGKVAPIANTVGVSVDEMLGSIAALTKQGIKTTEAVTALKAAFSNIIKPSSQAKEVAEELGIQFDAAALKSKGLEQFLIDIATATKGDTEAMSKLFGSVEALNAVFALTSTTGGKDFNQILKDMGKSAGETSTAFDKQTQTYDHAVESLKNSVEKIGITVGAKIAPELAKAAEAIAKWLESSEGMENSGLDAFVNLLKEAFSALVGILKALQPLWDIFVTAVELATTAIKALKVILEPILAVFNALLQAVAKVADIISKVLTPVINGIAKSFELVIGLIDTLTFGLLGLGDKAEKSFGKVSKGAQRAYTETEKLNQSLVETGKIGEEGTKVLNEFSGDIDVNKAGKIQSIIDNIKAAGAGTSAANYSKIRAEIEKLAALGIDVKELKDDLLFTTFGDSLKSLKELEVGIKDINKAQADNKTASSEFLSDIKSKLGTADPMAYAAAIKAVTEAQNDYNKAYAAYRKNYDEQGNPISLLGKFGASTGLETGKEYLQSRTEEIKNLLRYELQQAGFTIKISAGPELDPEKLQKFKENLQQIKSDITVEFKGQGSSVLPLSEKIAEMSGKIEEFGMCVETTSPTLKVAFQDMAGDSLSTALNTTERSFNNMFDSIMEGTFNVKESFRGMIVDILQSVGKMLASQAIKSFVSMLASSIGSYGGFSIPGFAEGGVAQGGKPAIVGERGPELFIPRGTGTVVPNNQLGGLGGGGNVNITNNITVGEGSSGNREDDRRLSNDIARAIDEKIKMQIAQQMRPGGLLNQTQRLGAMR